MNKRVCAEELYYKTFSSPLGEMVLVSDRNSLRGVNFGTAVPEPFARANPRREDTPVLLQAAEELAAYFAGRLQRFTVPYRFEGTPFQEKVWRQLAKIPYGEVLSYREVAARVGNAKACRAVGQANHQNPLAIIVPCHRVIGEDGRLVGYGGGLDKKSRLLELEKGWQ